MRLTRAAAMSRSDLADRLRQEQLKVFERFHLVDRSVQPPSKNDDELRAALERFRRDAPGRFFAGAAHAAVPALIAERMPAARDRVLHAAAKSLAGRFELLGYRELGFGDPVDWQLDPLSGTKAALAHWTRIDPLDREAVGDHKVVWELNRHQWLLHWAQAYAFTRDERYAERSLEQIEAWLRANPAGRGVNWVSSLELALRLVSWCWTLVLLRDSAALRPERFARVVAAIEAHASHIARYLSTTYSPNTHLLGEALGLFYVGTLFPEIEPAAGWRTLGERILVDQLTHQVLPDGVCFEQSTCYQRYTAEMYMHFLLLAARNGLAVSSEVAARVQSCIDFLLALARADGTVPQIGDGDGGWLLPLVPRDAEDMRGVFGVAAALFGRSDYAEASAGAAPEVGWLLGPGALQEIPGTTHVHTPNPELTGASRLFANGGYAVLRSDSRPHAHRLTVDVGPLGCPNSSGHGHADLLSLTCDIFGQPCIVDPGMPTYGGDPACRAAFRSTALHSTVVVDGLSQAEPAGTFSWTTRPRAKLRGWSSTDRFDFVDGEHDAYRLRLPGLTHRRRVIFVKPRYWVVVDDLDDRGLGALRQIEIGFQFAPDYSLTVEKSWVRAASDSGRALLVQAAGLRLEPTIHEGELGQSPGRGWYSPVYGRLQAAPALVYRATAQLPYRAVTYLIPVEHADAPAPATFPPEEDVALLHRLLA